MTNVIKTLVSPEGTIRVDINEGDNSADVVAKMELAIADHPLTAKLGRTSVKDMMYGRKNSVSGWYVEVGGKPTIDLTAEKPADTPAAPAPAPAAPAPAPAAPVQSPAAADVKHKTSRKPRQAKTKNAVAAVSRGRQEKIYKVGPKAADIKGTGMMAKITEAVKAGHNTQAKLVAFFPDAKKSTIQHEICCAGPTNRQYIVLDEDAMKNAVAAAPAPAASAPASAQAPAQAPAAKTDAAQQTATA